MEHRPEDETRKQALGSMQLSQGKLKETNSARLQQKQSLRKGEEERREHKEQEDALSKQKKRSGNE